MTFSSKEQQTITSPTSLLQVILVLPTIWTIITILGKLPRPVSQRIRHGLPALAVRASSALAQPSMKQHGAAAGAALVASTRCPPIRKCSPQRYRSCSTIVVGFLMFQRRPTLL